MFDPMKDVGTRVYPVEYMRLLGEAIRLLKQPLILETRQPGLEEIISTSQVAYSDAVCFVCVFEEKQMTFKETKYVT
jgi:hypothetical protein